MANPLKGEAALALQDGRAFTLAFDFDALIEAEQAYGKPLGQLLAEAKAGFLGAFRALLWAGLLRHHPGTTKAEAGEILLASQDAANEALSAALASAMPASDQAEAEGDTAGNAARAVRRPAGKSSGGNGAKPGSTRKRSGGQPRAASR